MQFHPNLFGYYSGDSDPTMSDSVHHEKVHSVLRYAAPVHLVLRVLDIAPPNSRPRADPLLLRGDGVASLVNRGDAAIAPPTTATS